MNTNDVEPLFYECKYCNKKIIKKKSFEAHECEKLKRFRVCRTKNGVSAFDSYVYWLSLKNNKILKISTFINSRFFNTFVKFQEFSVENGIPDKLMYIRFMHEQSIPPMLWRTVSAYEDFISYYDKTCSPLDNVKTTLKTMLNISSSIGCDISEVFDNMLPSEIARLLFERRFSPWLLLFSQKFKHYLHMLPDPSHHLMISTMISPSEWHDKIKKDQCSVEKIKKILKEIGV